MKNFSQFIEHARSAIPQIVDHFDLTSDQIREEYLSGNIFKENTWIIQNETDKIGKIIRRGANHLICVDEEGSMFRAWITDVKEYFLIGTDEYRKHAQKYTPHQPAIPFVKVKIKSSYK